MTTTDPSKPFIPSSSAALDSRYELAPEMLRKPPYLLRLGGGNYGEVWVAEFLCKETDKWIKVAKKTTKDPKTSTTIELERQMHSLRKEIEIMADLSGHPYVLRFLGAVTISDVQFCIVTELCEFGSLEEFLKKKSSLHKFIDEIIPNINHLVEQSSRTQYRAEMEKGWSSAFQSRRKQGELTTSDLLAFSYQIATGMIFLQEKQILHRDLALRNILLTGNLITKIADFGLARKTKDGAYISENPHMIEFPLNTPPDNNLEIGCALSLKADWWSFGDLLWEMFHLGTVKPFANQTRASMIDFLAKGNRLNRPEFVPREIYDLMNDVWLIDPEDRATLTECRRKLKVQLKISCPPLADELIAIDKKIELQQIENDDDPNKPMIFTEETPLTQTADYIHITVEEFPEGTNSPYSPYHLPPW